MTRDEYDTLRDWLRVKWIPGDPSADDLALDYLALTDAEQADAVRGMSDDEVGFWIELETAWALHVDPVHRESGITEAKVARYPERYWWKP